MNAQYLQMISKPSDATHGLLSGRLSNKRNQVLKRALRLFSALLVLITLFVLHPGTSAAQEETPVGEGEQLQELRERLQKLEQEIESLKQERKPVIPQDEKEQRIVAMLETPYLGRYYDRGSNNRYARYFVAKLNLINLTPNLVEIEQKDISLVADGTAIPLGPVDERIQYESFQIGNQHQQLRNIQPAKQVRLPSGGMRSTWLVFSGLDDGSHVPEMTLKIQHGDKTLELDINQLQLAVLGLEIERIGPRGCLAVFTLSGELNTINIGSLMDQLDNLTTKQVVRVVLKWTEAAPPPDQRLMNWLAQTADNRNLHNYSNEQFPPLPTTMREFHLCQLPQAEGSSGSRYNRYGNNANIHETAAEAVSDALESAYSSLPRDEILANIEQGNLLSRAAALAAGGGRLAEDKLPLILEYADHQEPALQLAALKPLRHFGEPAAVEKLVFYVKKNNEPLASAAIESLAESRYAAAHDALLDIMKNEPPASQKKIVRVLAEHPRPIWSEAIYQFIKDPREGLNLEALEALTQVGHPKLVEVLKNTLEVGDVKLRNKSFTILAARTDHESEQIAIEYALKKLAEDEVHPETYNAALNLLNRVKDKRAAPLLIEQYSKQSNKQQTLRTLAVIGGDDVVAFFVENFSGMQSSEKTEALKGLRALQAPEFRKLAAEALNSENHSLAQVAASELYQEGSAEAIDVLIQTLKSSSNNITISVICNVLGQLATSQASEALIEVRDSGDEQKRQYARNALRQIHQRSPAMQYVNRGRQLDAQKKYDEAVKEYAQAIEIDPQLPDSYIGRANIFLRQEKFDQASPDFEKALKLDPWNSQALTGVCVVMVMKEGESQKAVERLEQNREKFRNDAIFDYNAACVYARAVEHLRKSDPSEERDATIQKYEEKALADLQESVKRGFQDFKWMREDPDLKSLHTLPKFRELSKWPDDKPIPDDKPKEDEQPKPDETPAATS